jgi:hypothetical protein
MTDKIAISLNLTHPKGIRPEKMGKQKRLEFHAMKLSEKDDENKDEWTKCAPILGENTIQFTLEYFYLGFSSKSSPQCGTVRLLGSTFWSREKVDDTDEDMDEK